jgi:UDP-GlcNAc3NAcA epimerase
MKKILTLVGARPQFIKAAPVSSALSKTPGLQEVLVHSGQHYDANMSDVFFQQLGIPEPAYNLGCEGTSHAAQTASILVRFEEVILKEQPDCVIVYGDTNSTLAGALAAVKLKVPVAHIEAGIRIHDLDAPEEVNRIVADHLSQRHYALLRRSVEALLAEGIPEERVKFVGDVMLDIFRQTAPLRRDCDILDRLGLQPRDYLLVTVHRAENTDEPAALRATVEFVNACSRHVRAVWPMHPRTRKQLAGLDVQPDPDAVLVCDPVGYVEATTLVERSRGVITDSGGVSREAYFSEVRSLYIYHETPWEEVARDVWLRYQPAKTLPDTDPSEMVEWLRGKGEPGEHFGKGNAADLIAADLSDWLVR